MSLGSLRMITNSLSVNEAANFVSILESRRDPVEQDLAMMEFRRLVTSLVDRRSS